MTRYIGLTIGPIVDTLSEARKTGELWGASYIFSYLMKKIIEDLKLKIREENFIIPYTREEVFHKKEGIGFFHDRFIFKTENEEEDFKLIKEIIDKQFKDLADDIYKCICGEKQYNYDSKAVKSKAEIKEFLEEYFQIYFLSHEIDDTENISDDDKNPILVINKLLDSIELRAKSVVKVKENKNYIFRYLSSIKKSDLFKNAFNEENRFSSFSSLLKISTKEFEYLLEENNEHSEFNKVQNSNKEYDNDDEKYMERLKSALRKKYSKEEIKKLFKKAHKYTAIVQSDGDSIGKIITQLKENNNDSKYTYKTFSSKLFNFADKANKSVKKYGGFTVYAGGDDLLFFAPVINKVKGENKNIFNLIDDICKDFNDEFNEYINDSKIEKKPSLSFGVSITYYRYPLYESLEEARNLLFGQAKNYKCSILDDNGEVILKEKNAVAIKLLKHSGQSFDIILNKESDSYEKFKELLENTRDTETLKSLQYRIDKDKTLIKKIIDYEICENNCDDKFSAEGILCNKALNNYFKNNVLDKVRKDKKEVNEYIEAVKNLIRIIIRENVAKIKEVQEGNQDKIKEEVIKSIYAYLKFINFLNEEGGLDD